MADLLRTWSVLPLVLASWRVQTQPMMLIHCPSLGDELIPPRRIHSLTNTDHGILMRINCYCGRRHVVRTGRRAQAL